MYSYERFKTIAEARTRKNQLVKEGYSVTLYKGHREYVVQYHVLKFGGG